MKKIVYSICVLLTSLFFTRSAHAMWPDFTPAIPFSPQLCVMCIPPAISVAVSYYDQAMQLKEDLEKYTKMTTLKQMAASYVSKMGTTAFNKWRQSRNTKDRGISYARTIEKSKIADVTDEVSVKNAFVKLFMQYPSNKTRTKTAYKTIGEQLKMDTTLEMYLTAVEMEKRLYGNTQNGKENNDSKNMEDLGLLKQVDLIESCLVQGENCDIVGLDSCQEQSGGDSDETKEDHACFWNSALQAEKFYDEIMRYNLLLIAMHVQYQAVTGIDILAKIKEYEDKKKKEKDKDNKTEEKSSLLIEEYLMPRMNTAKSSISAQVAFADMTSEEEAFAEEELSGYEESLLTHENVIDGSFEDANHPDGFTLTIGERGDDIASLEIIEDARSDLNQAQKIHNLKKTLPEYRKVYQDYADAQAKMEQAKINLQMSGECVENMMTPYYENPNAVWLGGNCSYYREGQLICHYEPEKTLDDDSESEGLFDILCPDDDEHNCYVQELRSSNITGGVAKYLLELYSAAKDEDAAGDTEAFIDTKEEQQEGSFGSTVTITTGGKGSEVDKEEDSLFATSRDSDETLDEKNLDKMSEQTSDNGSDESVSNMKDQEKGEEEKEQARKDGLIRWVIGSEVAKELALDLDTGEHEWGDVRQSFPLWNDQIAYYTQYIDGKYENIKDYINSMSQVDILLKLATTLNVIYPYKVIESIPPISAETQRKESEDILTELGETLKEMKEEFFDEPVTEDNNVTFDDIYNKQIEDVIAAEEKKIQTIRSEYEQSRASMVSRLKALYAIMNEANTNLSALNGEYNQNNEVVKKGDATTPEASEGLDYGKTLYTKRKLSKDSPQNADFNATKESNNKNSAEAREKQAVIGNKAENYERIVKMAEKNVKKIKEELDELRRAYVKKLSDAEAGGKTQFVEFTNDLRSSRQIGAWTLAMGKVAPLELSDNLLKCIKTYALEKVDEAKGKINKMKEDLSLYYVSGAEKVQEIHNKMINEITQIPIDKLAECAALGEISDFDESSEEDIKPVINVFQDICKEDFCTTPDSEYFVGAIGLPRDFAAPRPPLDFSSAPLHEIFHFDVIDFNNVDKYYNDKDDIYSNKKMYTSFESFLNFLNASSSGFEYGGTTYDSAVPVIWKYILKRHAFVQKEMDLTALLGESEETGDDTLAANNESTILRAGIFPCLIEDKYVIDVEKPEKIVLPSFVKLKIKERFYAYNLNRKPEDTVVEYANLPVCRAVDLQKVKGKVVIYDKEAGISFEIKNIGTLRQGSTRSSELGTIMSYVVDESTVLNELLKAGLMSKKIDRASLPHRLTFNQTVLDAIAAIDKTEDLDDDEEAAKFYMANRLLYDSNQFGDYLEQVEQESVIADAMEKIKKQIEEIVGKLTEVFAAADYAMSDDFNLLNDEDYATAAKIMDEQKELYLDLATQKLNNIPDKNIQSQSLRDKKEKLVHKRALLQKDSEEVVTINGSESEDELEERIAQQNADSKVDDKYQEKKKEELERQKKHIKMPYCAFYPTTDATTQYSHKTKGGEQKSEAQPESGAQDAVNPQEEIIPEENYATGDEKISAEPATAQARAREIIAPAAAGKVAISVEDSDKADSTVGRVAISDENSDKADSAVGRVAISIEDSDKADSTVGRVAISDKNSDRADSTVGRVAISDENSDKADSAVGRVAISIEDSDKADSTVGRVAISDENSDRVSNAVGQVEFTDEEIAPQTAKKSGAWNFIGGVFK